MTDRHSPPGAAPDDAEPYASDDQPSEAPHLLDYVRRLVRRRHTVMVTFALTFLLTAVYTFTATPVYEGRVQLLIETEDPNIVAFAQVVDEGPTRQDYYQTQYRLIQSRSVAKKTLDALNLWTNPELAPDPGAAGAGLGGVLRDAATWLTSLVHVPVESLGGPASGETASQARSINAFLRRLTVKPVRSSRLVEVSYRSRNPALAARVADAVAASYIQQNLDFRFTTTRDASSWLEKQLAEQRLAVEKAEKRLQQYREQNEAISFDERENIVVQRLTDVNAAVTKARTERLQKEAMYNQLLALEQDPARLETFPAILANESIVQMKATLAQLQREQAQLGERLGDRHPDMIKLRSAIEAVTSRIKGQIAEVVQAVRIEYDAVLEQERSLAAALATQRAQALAMNRKAIDYAVIERDVQSSKQIYEALLRRTMEVGVSGNLRTSNVRVVDAAEVPTSPVSPQRRLNLLLGAVGGLILGVGLAFFFEYLDNRLRTPEDIETQLGLPAIGLIPAVSADTRHMIINDGVPASFAEAFSTLRTNILFSATEDGCRSIVVTSAAPREGKTVVATNLAVSMALADRRVLLVDADMRRPSSHVAFDLEVEPGLSNLLVGAATLREVVKPTRLSPHLYVLTAGRTPPNPAELLGSRRFVDLLDSLRSEFDVVILDTPPAMAVTDAAIVSHVSSGVLFVVSADVTSRYVARQALTQLAHARVRLVGAVLNRVDLERNAYYYARYYRKDYARYYSVASR